MLRRGLSLVVSIQKGSIFDDLRLDIYASCPENPPTTIATPRTNFQNHNANLELAPFSSRKLHWTSSKLPKVFTTQKSQKHNISSSNQACFLTLKYSFTLHHFHSQSFLFISNFFLSFSFSSFLWFSFQTNTMTITKFKNQRKYLYIVKSQLFKGDFNSSD